MHQLSIPLVALMLAADLAVAADVNVPQCYVLVKREVEVAAQEPGLLDAFEVEKGEAVEAEALVAKIDSSQAEMKHQVAQAEYQAAVYQAKNDVNVRFSKAAEGVALAELQKAKEANDPRKGGLANAVSSAELRRLDLSWVKSKLGIEQAEMEYEVAKLTAKVKQTEMAAAALDVQRRQVKSPINGVVIDVFKEKGEWVQAGEPVATIVQMDVLKVEGYVNINQVSPADVKFKPVTIRAKLTGDQEVEFTGKITFVNPIVEIGGPYRVSADIANRQDSTGEWLLRPGLETTMTIHLDGTPTAAQPARRK